MGQGQMAIKKPRQEDGAQVYELPISKRAFSRRPHIRPESITKSNLSIGATKRMDR